LKTTVSVHIHNVTIKYTENRDANMCKDFFKTFLYLVKQANAWMEPEIGASPSIIHQDWR